MDYECAIFFDYITGELLKCSVGDENSVSVAFEENEFENHRVCSIHNHPDFLFPTPSEKDFGILAKDFEDYALVASSEELWIIKAKIVSKQLESDIKESCELNYKLINVYFNLKFDDDEIVNKMIHVSYEIIC